MSGFCGDFTKRVFGAVLVGLIGIVGMGIPLAHADTVTQPLRTLGFPFNGGDVAFSPDGESVLLSNWEGAVLVKLTTGFVVRRFDAGSDVYSLAFSPDGSQVLLVTSRDGAILYLASSGAEVRRFAAASDYSIAYSPDGSQVLLGANNRNRCASYV